MFESLNEQQSEAVMNTEGPMAVIASAGSGKSRILTYKVAKLLENGVEPSSILATTFTKKASKVIHKRIIKLCGEKAKTVNVSTLHSFSYKILRLIYRRKEMIAPSIVTDFEVYQFLRETSSNNGYIYVDQKDFNQQISFWKLHEVLPSHIINSKDFQEISSIHSPKDNQYVAKVFLYRDYQSFLISNNYIDFSDMLMLTVNYLKRTPEFVQKLRNKIKYILVDEFQDTNHISYELYKLLISDEKNITVLGDKRQAIYSFQGSAHYFFDKFCNDYKPKIVNLTHNYRSYSEIIELGNKLSRNMDSSNIDTIGTRGAGATINTMVSLDDIDEKYKVTDQIKVLIDMGEDPNHIAILYRTNAQALPFVDQLESLDIPFICHSDINVYKMHELNVLCAYLQMAFEPKRMKLGQYLTLLNNPSLYVASKIANEQYKKYKKQDLLASINDNLLSVKQKNAKKPINDVQRLYDTLFDLRHNNLKTHECLRLILDKGGWKKFLVDKHSDGKTDSESVDVDSLTNIDVILNMTKEHEDPLQFLEYVEEKVNEKKPKHKNGVNLMTIHRSKGLEFKHVFVVGMCDRMMPYYKSCSSMEQLLEERRIAYVAVTRAEDSLYLSSIGERFGINNVNPSPYLREMEVKFENHYR